ncbi:toll/interleukin-1 receptor domain-containing protein [Streptomyces coelicoflavus]|uniref:toll/interleukin-1 receptor domain-containing protein n=1 Tax=Streptomyces coelicoflavus TaxID=285562 RepID=UPI003627F7AD
MVHDRAVDPWLVFVSHSRRDRSSTLRLVRRLRSTGLHPWICGPELHSPAWRDTVFPQIEHCRMVVVVSSAHADAADGVRQEIAYAELLGKPVVRVGAHDTGLRSVPQRQHEACCVRGVDDDAQFAAHRSATSVFTERRQGHVDERLTLQLQP